jgi:phage terminase large subunit
MTEVYKPRQAFMPFHLRDKRWACLVCHRRAGKTVSCINELLTRALACKKDYPQYAYIGPFLTQTKRIAWRYLKQYGAILSPKTNESELYVEFVNANGKVARIYLVGGENAESLRGMYFDGVVLDEFADMRPKVWDEIVRPALSDRRGWAVFIGTPKGHNEFYKIYMTAKTNPDDWFCMMLKASESGLLPPGELESLRKEYAGNEDKFNQEYECDFEAAIPGAVYGKWMAEAEEQGRIDTVAPDLNLPVHTAWDLGYDDATAIWWFQVGMGELRILEYYENNGEDIAHYCEVIKSKRYKYGKHFVPHDAANELLAAGGRSIVQQAFKLGVKMHVVAATSQQNGIEATRATIKRSWFDRQGCGDGLEALKQYQFEWDDDKKVYRNKPRHDWTSHGSDAFEIIGQVWKQPRLIEAEDKPRFLNDMTAGELFALNEANSTRRERI